MRIIVLRPFCLEQTGEASGTVSNAHWIDRPCTQSWNASASTSTACSRKQAPWTCAAGRPGPGGSTRLLFRMLFGYMPTEVYQAVGDRQVKGGPWNDLGNALGITHEIAGANAQARTCNLRAAEGYSRSETAAEAARTPAGAPPRLDESPLRSITSARAETTVS